jgi:hypothetical protein
MKTTLALIVATGVGFGIGFTVGRVSIGGDYPLIQPSTTANSLISYQPTKTNKELSHGGVDRYEIQYLGGGRFSAASYVVSYPGKLQKIRTIKGPFPKTIKFSLYKGASVAASLMGNNDGKVIIFRNGVDCGKAWYEGSYAEANKICK